MRMPPQMIYLRVLRGISNTTGYSPELQAVKRLQTTVIRPQEPAGGQIHNAVCALERISVVAGNVNVSVYEPMRPRHKTFALLAATRVEPGFLGSAITPYAQISACFQIRRVDLIAREHQALYLHSHCIGHSACGL